MSQSHYAWLKAQHLCGRCGKTRTHNTVMCPPCLKQIRDYHRRDRVTNYRGHRGNQFPEVLTPEQEAAFARMDERSELMGSLREAGVFAWSVPQGGHQVSPKSLSWKA